MNVSPSQQPVIDARNQLDPLLEALVKQLDEEGQATQQAFFSRIRTSIQKAQDEVGLAAPFMELSTTAFVGFEFSADAIALIDRILEKAENIAASFSADDSPPH
ncbi:MAG: hypothetical protein AAF515_19055 [Pseudomonadota bacterium]